MCGVVKDVTETLQPAQPTSLTRSDRCDRCGAQARVRVVLLAGDLLFCAHHAKAYEDKLRDSALEWTDERALVEADKD